MVASCSLLKSSSTQQRVQDPCQAKNRALHIALAVSGLVLGTLWITCSSFAYAQGASRFIVNMSTASFLTGLSAAILLHLVQQEVEAKKNINLPSGHASEPLLRAGAAELLPTGERPQQSAPSNEDSAQADSGIAQKASSLSAAVATAQDASSATRGDSLSAGQRYATGPSARAASGVAPRALSRSEQRPGGAATERNAQAARPSGSAARGASGVAPRALPHSAEQRPAGGATERNAQAARPSGSAAGAASGAAPRGLSRSAEQRTAGGAGAPPQRSRAAQERWTEPEDHLDGQRPERKGGEGDDLDLGRSYMMLSRGLEGLDSPPLGALESTLDMSYLVLGPVGPGRPGATGSAPGASPKVARAAHVQLSVSEDEGSDSGEMFGAASEQLGGSGEIDRGAAEGSH